MDLISVTCNGATVLILAENPCSEMICWPGELRLLSFDATFLKSNLYWFRARGYVRSAAASLPRSSELILPNYAQDELKRLGTLPELPPTLRTLDCSSLDQLMKCQEFRMCPSKCTATCETFAVANNSNALPQIQRLCSPYTFIDRLMLALFE